MNVECSQSTNIHNFKASMYEYNKSILYKEVGIKIFMIIDILCEYQIVSYF